MAVFVCPKCDHTQHAPDEYVGRTAKCLKCETKAPIQDRKPAPPPPPSKLKSPPKPTVTDTDTKSDGAVVNTLSKITKSQIHIITGLLAALLVAQLFGLTSTQTSMTEWEYTIESPSDSTLQMELDRLGGQGWELVFARRATSEYGSPSYEMMFKRPIK